MLPWTSCSRRASSKDEGKKRSSNGNAANQSETSVETGHAPHLRPEVAHTLAQGRAAWLLQPSKVSSLEPSEWRAASKSLQQSMALIHAGTCYVPGRDWRLDAEEATLRPLAAVAVDAFWMDRFAVTNRQFWEFVRDGGYRDARWWHPEIREARQEFTDQSGLPGPRFWHQGRYPHELAEHPVVGVCWYEAAAYAQWAGKRLPTDPEWLQAVSNLASRNQQWSVTPFPWGDLFDPQLANLWETDLGRTAPVDAFPGGDSPEGVRQLVGNVWEWTSSGYGEYDVGTDFVTPALWKSLRGGAFDTYFANQAGRFFQSGDSPLARRRNVGFRCVVSASCVALAPEETP